MRRGDRAYGSLEGITNVLHDGLSRRTPSATHTKFSEKKQGGSQEKGKTRASYASTQG